MHMHMHMQKQILRERSVSALNISPSLGGTARFSERSNRRPVTALSPRTQLLGIGTTVLGI